MVRGLKGFNIASAPFAFSVFDLQKAAPLRIYSDASWEKGQSLK
jgi:hypothetical protein